MARRPRVPKGTIKTKVPPLGKGRAQSLSAPDGGEYLRVGRLPYRDANPNLWGAGGSVLFYPSLSSANREILPHRDKAVANAREADRNHALINAGIDFRAVNTVGAQLRLQYLPNWAALGVDPDSPEAVQFVQDMENHYSLWGDDHRLLCDAQRQGQFGALMLLACREALGTEGECLVISRYDEERMIRYRGSYAKFLEVVS